MAINFESLSKSTRIFRQLTGLTVIEFKKVIKRLSPSWEKLEAQKKCHRKNAHITTFRDKILCV